MPAAELAQLIAAAKQLSPARSPGEAMELNQRILQHDPTNAAAYVRQARAYHAQRKFTEAKEACQDALWLNPGSTVAKQHLQRITEEWAIAKQAQAVTSFEEALRRGKEQKEDEYGELAIAYTAMDRSKAMSPSSKRAWVPKRQCASEWMPSSPACKSVKRR